MKYEISLIVAGREVDTYTHESDTYIEGRKGSSYQIRLKNNTATEALFIVSVDGLSIMNSEPASKDSKGYIVSAYGKLDVDGWLVDEKTAAKFVFGTKDSSYVAAIEGDVDNTGVIGLQVFEKKQPVNIYPHYPHYIHNWYPLKQTLPNWPYWNNIIYGAGEARWPSSFTLGGSVKADTVGVINHSLNQVIGSSLSGSSAQCMNSSTPTPASTTSAFGPSLDSFEMPSEISSLATEFGEATEFKTTSVSFEKSTENPVYQTAIFYATAKELNTLGIVLKWQKPKIKKPVAFPGDFCKKPDNWKN